MAQTAKLTQIAKLTWSDRLSCGVAVIDDDHQVLVNQFNRLAGTLSADGGDTKVIGGVITALLDYTAFHFEREHRLMQMTGFPGLQSHVTEHEGLLERLYGMNMDWRSGTASGQALMAFLGEWLTKHILGSDRALGRHIVDNGGEKLIAPLPRRDSVVWADVTVLVVDDSTDFRRLLRSVLANLGIRTVVEARNGAEALERMRTQTFDVVLVDDDMPVLDGIAMTRQVRHSKGCPDPRTCVILMASEGMTRQHLREATLAGVHDLLVKPITPVAVQARLKRHLTKPLSFQDVDGALVPVRTAG